MCLRKKSKTRGSQKPLAEHAEPIPDNIGREVAAVVLGLVIARVRRKAIGAAILYFAPLTWTYKQITKKRR